MAVDPLASYMYLEGDPLTWMMPLHLNLNQKSDYDDNNDDGMMVFAKFMIN